MEKNQNENKIIFELNVKFQMGDYRLKMISTKSWVLAAILLIIRLVIDYIHRRGP